MWRSRIPLLLGLSLVLGAAEMGAADPAGLSPRIANYTVEVKLDPVKKMLEGRSVLS